MQDRIRTLVTLLEKNHADDEAMTGLMELVTGDESTSHGAQIRESLGECRRDLVRRGRADVAVRLLELEMALAQGPADEAQLVLEEARLLDEEMFDQERALIAYRKASSLQPEDPEIQAKIQGIEDERANYREISDKFAEQAAEAEDAALRAHMLMCAAERLYKNGHRDESLAALLTQALDADPTHVRAARLLEKLYVSLEKWGDLSDLYLRLVEQRQPREERLVLLQSAARLKAGKLEDHEGAAMIYAEILDLDPGNDAALRYLAKHYEAKEDWDHLVALYEDALAGGPKREEEIALLTQLGMTHWRMRSDMDKAEGYFKRLRKLEPAHPAMLNFYRAYAAHVEDNSKLIQILNDAQRSTSDKSLKDQLTKEIAQLSAVDGGNVERAIEAWKSVLRKEPGNEEARRELRRLYFESQKWNGLLDLLRSEAEALPVEDVAGKVALYEEIVRIYRDHLELGTMVINTYKTIIELDPFNVEAQIELSKNYEREGRWNDLINLLSARAERITDRLEKVEILSRVATLWIERFNNFNRALGPLEEIRALDPTNQKANETLRSVYIKRRSWKQLLDLMEDEAKSLCGASLVAHLKEMAVLAADKLSDAERAVAVWKRVLDESPGDEEALSILEKLHERTKDWAGLASVLERRIARCGNENDRIALLIKLGTVAKERLKDPALTAQAWHKVLEIQPGHTKAMRSLKEAYLQAEDWASLEKLYVGAGDYEGLVDVLGVSADRVEDIEVKKALSFRCAELYENEIGQAERAIRHYERVLAAQADNERAARALAPIYRRAEKWNRLVGVLEIVLGHTADPVERVVIMDELRDIGATRMNNRNMAFEWAAKAYAELPEDEGVRQTLESTAEAAGKLEELVGIYRQRLESLDPEGQIAMQRRIADLCLRRIGDTEGGIAAWRAVLAAVPSDSEAIAALDTVLRSSAAWEDLIALYEHRLSLASGDEERCLLLHELGSLLEDGMDRLDDAASRYREVLSLVPDDGEALVALERIARAKEDWKGLADILEKRRAVAGDDGTWRTLTFQLAEVVDNLLGDPKASIAVYQELLEQYPADPEVIAAMEHFLRLEATQVEVAKLLEPHLYASDSHRLLAWALSIELEATTDPDKRLSLHRKLSDLYREKLGDPRLTFETLAAALREHPNNKELWDDLQTLANELGAQEDLALHYITAYDSGKLEEGELVSLASRLAHLLEIELGRVKDAAPYHERVFAADPKAGTPFHALEGFYTTEERWKDLLHLYRRALDGGSSVYPQLDLRLKICFILEEVQQDAPAAIDEYRLVIDADPRNAQANRALTILYEQCERWTDLEALLEAQLSRADDAEAVALRYRLGELCEHKLDKKAAAFDYYELVLLQDPDHLRAQKAMERLLERGELRQRAAKVLEQTYEHQGAAEPLARVLGVQLEDDSLTVDARIDILMRVAALRERRLGDIDGAFSALSQAFALNPASTFSRNELARVAAEAGMAAEYAGVIDQVIPAVLDDHALAANLMSEVARLYDEQLGDLGKAEAAYRRLIDLDPTNRETALPAAEALERLLSGSESFEPLLSVLRLKVGLLDDRSEQIRVLHRMAEIEESVLERVENAVELYREILDEDPADMPALYGLERLFERLGKWRNLVDILRHRVSVETDGEIRLELLLRVARLFEEKLSSLDEAIAAYIAVGEESGPNLEAIDALIRLYETSERWRDLLSTLEAKDQLVDDPFQRTRLLFSMGELLRLRLDDPAGAVERLGQALEIEPRHAGARAALNELLASPVRLDAIRILRPLFEADGDYSQLLRCALIEAEETDDPLARSGVLQKAAEIAEVGLSDLPQAFLLLGRALRDGTTAPELPRIIDDLERLAESTGNAEQLLSLYREVAPDILDADLQIHCALRVAELSEAKGDLASAREHYVRILDIDSENTRALDALTNIYEATSQWVELLDIYRRKINLATDETHRLEILFKQAALCEDRLEDISQATTTYETILAEVPGNKRAMGALERLYEREGRYADLASLLEQRAEIDVADRADLLHRLGLLASDKLGDDERALDYFRQVLDIDHLHTATIASLEAAMSDEGKRGRVAEILEPVYKGSCDWLKLVGALEARLEFADDNLSRKELLRQIGTLYEEQLGDLDKAFETFARLFSEDVEDKSSWDILERLASVLEKWGRLAEVYADALDGIVSDTPNTAELAFILGEIYETRLTDPPKATAAYRRAMSYAPDNEQAYSAVERMLVLTSSWNDLLDLYRDAADTALDMEKRRELIYKMADIHEHALGDLDAAIDAFRSVLDLDDRDTRSIEALDRLYATARRFEDLTTHLRTQVDQEGDPAARNELRCRLARVYEENLEDPTSAVDVYEEALHEEGGGISAPLAALERLILNEDLRQRIAEILEPCYRETDEWKKLVVILRTQIDYLDDPVERAQRYREIAELHNRRGQNFLLAFESLSEALRAQPQDRETLAELVRLTGSIENWDVLAGVLSGCVEDIYDLDFKAEVFHLLGAIYDRHLDQPRKAIEAFLKVLDINEADAEAISALEGLYNLVGDWDGLVAVLARKAEHASDPTVRAEILRNKASIHEDLMSDVEQAIEAYRAALEAEPTSIVTISALERLYEATAAWRDLVDILRHRLELTDEKEARCAILRTVAVVYEDRLKDTFEAISSWRAVLDEDGKDRVAVAALAKLYAAEGMYADLLEVLELERSIAPDQQSWVEACLRIASLQEKELADPGAAIGSYRDVLSQHPTNAVAIAALERIAADETYRAPAIEVLEPLHRDAARWDRLVAVLELKLAILTEPAARQAELVAIAELHEVGRSNPIAAFEAYDRALAEDASNVAVLDNLERIARGERLFDRLAESLSRRVENVYDPAVEIELLTRLGRIREVELHDARGAIAALRRALDAGADDPALLLSLDRLYEREGMWTELDEVLEREIQHADSRADINALKLRQGRIREREFQDVSLAISAYRDVVESSPENDEAIAALEALLEKDDYVADLVDVLMPVYKTRGEHHKISALYGHQLRVVDLEGEKVQLYKSLAAHQEQAIGDLSAAFDAYATAFAIDPADGALLQELERLAAELGAWAALVEAVEGVLNAQNGSIDSMLAVELGLRVARWAGTQLGAPAKAEQFLRQVLEREPENQEALAMLEELLRGLGRFEELLPVMHKHAETMYDFEAKKTHLKTLAEIARVELADPRRARDAYEEAYSIDEADLDVIDALCALCEELEDYPRLSELLAVRAGYTNDPILANRFRHRLATLLVGPLSDASKAASVYQEILDVDLADSEAAVQLESLLRHLSRYADLREVLLRQLDAASSSSERSAVLLRLAELAETHLDDADEAISHLNEVLLSEPDTQQAVDSLVRLYTRTERWHDLVDLLQGRADLARDAGRNEEELGLLVSIGQIFDEHLSDSRAATEIYERVLEREPEHTRALTALARLYETASEWEKCAEVLERAVRSGRGDRDEAEVHFRLARLKSTRLGDEAAALEELRAAVACDPTHRAANDALAEAARKSGDNEELLAALVRGEQAMEAGPAKVARLVEIARLLRGALGDDARAAEVLERARSLDAGNKDVLLLLCDAYVGAGHQDRAVPVLEALIDAETDGGKKRSKQAAVYHQRLALAYRARGDEDAALMNLEAAYKLDISNVEVLISLGKLYYERNDLEQAVKLFRALLLQKFDASAGASKADIYWYVGDIALRQGDPRKAKGMFQRGLDEDKEHALCKDGLARC